MSQRSIDQALQLAIQNHQSGKLAEAQKIYRDVLARQPNNPHALHLLGVIAAQLHQTDAAIELIRRAISSNPSAADYHNNLGNALRDNRLLDEAAAAYRQAIHLRPDYVVALNNLGNVLCDQGQLDEGIAFYRRALQLDPNHAGAHNNLGKALRDKGMLDEAVTALHDAIRLQGDYAEAHYNLSLVLLLKGDFAAGWPEHEWRWRMKTFEFEAAKIPGLRWNGEDLTGRTLLLHAEQGMGDTIQFARYVPMVAARGGKVVLQCQQPLLRLMKSLQGQDQLISVDAPLPQFDFHCPLMSLPPLFDTRAETIPAGVPYLRADENLSHQWASRVAHCHGLKVGIVWAGRAGYADDRNRSLPLSQFAPFAQMPGLTFFSLQKGEAASQSAPQGMEFVDCTSELNDFADTAALIANLDLVIAVDTAAAHLAGAMGKPVWVLLPYAPDWRWLLERDDSPWYPTMRLFRQKSLGDWTGVIERISHTLAGFREIPPAE